MKKLITVLFLMFLIVPMLYFYGVVFTEQNTESYIELRYLQTVPTFSLNDFYSGTYQKKLEDSITDQIYLSDEFKKGYYSVVYNINNTSTNFIDLFFDLSDKYINIKDGYFHYGYSDYIIQKKHNINDGDYDFYKKLYSKIKYENIPKYIFFINKDLSVDFSTNDYYEYNKFIKDNFEADYYGFFNINSYDDYKKYFYQTDHHWNYLGSYKGYTEIIKLLLGDQEELITPIEIKEYDYIFNGSYSRRASLPNSKEKFTVYTFPKLEYTRYNTEFQLPIKEFNLEQGRLFENYYAMYYGTHWIQMVYDFNQPDKENLLVISNSYVLPIDDLIASHFNKTFYLDIRGNESVNEKSYFKNYIERNNINKILIIGDTDTFFLR